MALRNRQLCTTRSDILSPCSSPDEGLGWGFGGTVLSIHEMADGDAQSGGRSLGLSPERENALWQNHLNEICLWVRYCFLFLLIYLFYSSTWQLNADFQSLTCSTTTVTSHPHSRKWPSPRLICATPSWRSLCDRSNDSRTRNPV